MILRSLGLRDFRNVAETRLGFAGKRQFFVGANGQGKTNLLEAVGCLTALRSFRTSDTGALVRQGAAEAAVAVEVGHERRGETKLTLVFREDGKQVFADGEKVKRLGDHLGHFPVVAFSSHDLQLVRGAPSVRRKWLDLTLSAMDAGYLQALQTYSRALAGRNRMLKTGGSPAEYTAFEKVMAPAAADILRARRGGVAELAVAAQSAYASVSAGAETVAIDYGGDELNAAEWLEAWDQGRAADLRMKTTLRGPHRHDLALSVKGAAARDFGSEGQQRSMVLALRLAQAAWFQARSGVRPVILADDVLGELDPDRRARFWAALDPESQVVASGTSLPAADLGEWQTFAVEAGRFREVSTTGVKPR